LQDVAGRVEMGCNVGDLAVHGPGTSGARRAYPWQDETRAAARTLKVVGGDLIKVHIAIEREPFRAVLDEARRLELSASARVLPLSGRLALVRGTSRGDNVCKV
jgi:hypothetical protein